MKKPMAEDGMIGKWMARVKAWREERESARLRKHVEEIKIAGRPPVTQQRVSQREELDEEEERRDRRAAAADSGERGPP